MRKRNEADENNPYALLMHDLDADLMWNNAKERWKRESGRT
jgi:hypothetical protein